MVYAPHEASLASFRSVVMAMAQAHPAVAEAVGALALPAAVSAAPVAVAKQLPVRRPPVWVSAV